MPWILQKQKTRKEIPVCFIFNFLAGPCPAFPDKKGRRVNPAIHSISPIPKPLVRVDSFSIVMYCDVVRLCGFILFPGIDLSQVFFEITDDIRSNDGKNHRKKLHPHIRMRLLLPAPALPE
jgi:hypothetical protein